MIIVHLVVFFVGGGHLFHWLLFALLLLLVLLGRRFVHELGFHHQLDDFVKTYVIVEQCVAIFKLKSETNFEL